MSGTKEVRVRACRTTTVICKKCSLTADKKDTLLCLKCNSRYHFDCAGHSEKLAKLCGQKNFTCKLCVPKINKPHQATRRVLPPPKSTSTPTATPTSNLNPSTSKPSNVDNVEFIANIPTSNSFDSLTTDDDDGSSNSNSMIEGDTATHIHSLNRSCPVGAVQTSNADVEELNKKISKLESQLKINDKLYSDLLMENGALKKAVADCELTIQKLTRICKSTTKKPKKDNVTKQGSNSTLKTKKQKLPELHLSDTVEKNINPTNKDLTSKSPDVFINSTCGSKHINHPETKSKILILADEQGQGLQHALQKLMGSRFEVCCIWKSGADFGEVIETCKSEIRNLLRTDYLIVLAGLNDSNPFILKMTLLKWLNLVCNTNVIICGLPSNAMLRCSTINYEIKLVCEAFNHCSYLRMNYKLSKIGSKYFTSDLSFAIAREIVHLSRLENCIASVAKPGYNYTPVILDDDFLLQTPFLSGNPPSPSKGIKFTSKQFFRS
ncbi:hypothetical protein O0L34_g887 [Tuta absoluta]|nr:hypothetical protein O0L34_g887 [Tuta absoluta]